MKQSRRWQLAGLSGGGAAAAVAAVIAHRLLQPMPPYAGSSRTWVVLGVGLGMALAATAAMAGVYRATLRYGIELAHEGRQRPLLCLAVGVAPWIAVVLGILSVATL